MKNTIKNLFFISLITAIICVTGYFLFITYKDIEISSNYEIYRTDSTINLQTVENVTEESKSIADMLEQVSKSVVGISRIKSHNNSIFSSGSVTELGIGTGVIISSNGYILSNCHVTGEKLSTCYVTLENGSSYEGTVLWCDSNLDLSITKINANNLTYAILGDSSKVKAGETVYAIGNPIGFEFRRTITSGIISALNRTIRIDENNSTTYMTDLIQTDAAINSGNSGGPLVSTNGNVLGINSVKITSAEGIGFAIPINVIKPVIEKFINENEFNEAYLGIFAYDKEVIPYLSSFNNYNSGIYVVNITNQSPALKSGIEIGDIITSIDGISINTMTELREYIFSKSPGDTVLINIKRGYISRTYEIVLTRK